MINHLHIYRTIIFLKKQYFFKISIKSSNPTNIEKNFSNYTCQNYDSMLYFISCLMCARSSAG